MNFEVIFYEKDKYKPIEDFLDKLPLKLRAKVLRDIELLSIYGSELREPYSKSLGNGIFELRTKQATNIVRSLYFFMFGKKIIITNIFIKKSEKTPSNEIKLAIERKKEYEKR